MAGVRRFAFSCSFLRVLQLHLASRVMFEVPVCMVVLPRDHRSETCKMVCVCVRACVCACVLMLT